MTWTGRRLRKRGTTRQPMVVGGLLPMALLAGGFALDADDDELALDAVAAA